MYVFTVLKKMGINMQFGPFSLKNANFFMFYDNKLFHQSNVFILFKLHLLSDKMNSSLQR